MFVHCYASIPPSVGWRKRTSLRHFAHPLSTVPYKPSGINRCLLKCWLSNVSYGIMSRFFLGQQSSYVKKQKVLGSGEKTPICEGNTANSEEVLQDMFIGDSTLECPVRWSHKLWTCQHGFCPWGELSSVKGGTYPVMFNSFILLTLNCPHLLSSREELMLSRSHPSPCFRVSQKTMFLNWVPQIPFRELRQCLPFSPVLCVPSPNKAFV